MHLDFSQDVRHCSAAHFRLRVHTFRFETATLKSTSSPACDLCEADDDGQDETRVLFQYTRPQMVSLRRSTLYYFHKQDPRMCLLLHQENNNCHLMNIFYVINRRQSYFLTEGLFLVNLEWSQSCVSCTAQVHLSGAHHTRYLKVSV